MSLLLEAWRSVAGDDPLPAPLHDDGDTDLLPTVFPVVQLASAAIGASLLAASQLQAVRTGRAPQEVQLDTAHLAAAIRSERYARLDDQPTESGFAPLSQFFPTEDGWIRLHANYPWHRERLLRVLGTDPDPAAVGAAVRRWRGEELEEAIFAAGGCAAFVRSREAWLSHLQGAVVSQLPLLSVEPCGDAPAVVFGPGRLPASGVRVLDLTRVIAGPVCTRTLAAHGADVLRIDSPNLPEVPQHTLDSLVGKRSALLDLRRPEDKHRFDELLEDAHVVVQGYRPGALTELGIAPEALIERRPGLIVVSLSAWGQSGPWSHRRGFDSLVQAASGIAVAESVEDGVPGVLPAQLLDHATGYLAAAAALRALAERHTRGRSWHIRLALAQTAAWLLRQPLSPKRAGRSIDLEACMQRLPGPVGVAHLVRPPGTIGGEPVAWPSPPPRYGTDAPAWRPD